MWRLSGNIARQSLWVQKVLFMNGFSVVWLAVFWRLDSLDFYGISPILFSVFPCFRRAQQANGVHLSFLFVSVSIHSVPSRVLFSFLALSWDTPFFLVLVVLSS